MSYCKRFLIMTLDAMISCITDITLQLPEGHSLKQSRFYFLAFLFLVFFWFFFFPRVNCVGK